MLIKTVFNNRDYLLKFYDFIIRLLLMPLSLSIALFPRKKNIWVVGAWDGKKYADNSKYLFEYIHKNVPSVKVYWITRCDDIYNDLINKKFPVLKTNTIRGFIICAKAHYVICSNGISDVNMFATFGSIRVQLWHGLPIKKIENDHITQFNTQKKIKSWISKITLNNIVFFPYLDNKWDLSISTSKLIQSRMSSALGINIRNVAITGYPRNDVLLKKQRFDQFESRCKSIVLYAPTFRNNICDNVSLLKKFLTDELVRFFNMSEFELHIKLHPILQSDDFFSPFKFLSKRIKFLNNHSTQDINEILPNYDILISDYSGVVLDFLLLNRPLISFSPDLNYYIGTNREFYEDYHDFFPGKICQTSVEVVDEIKKLQFNDCYFIKRNATKNRYHEHLDSESCRRTFEFLKELTNDCETR